MTLSIGRTAVPAPAVSVRRLCLPLALVVMAVLLVPLLLARPAHLTSDESLYLAEAYNIAQGEGLTYPSGDAISHRPPLYPLVLAPAVALGGPDAAYGVSAAIVALNAALVLLVAWRMAGAYAAALAGIATAASAYLNALGTTLYLDPLLVTFVLCATLCLWEARSSASPARWFAAAGLCTGLSFLVKESAAQFAPLPVVLCLVLPSLRTSAGARGCAAFYLTAATAIAPWFAWVHVHTDQIYMLGRPSMTNDLLLGGVTLAVLALAATALLRRRLILDRRWHFASTLIAAGLTVAWGAFVLYGLERHAGWHYSLDYWRTVPEYLVTVAPEAQPYFLLALAWGVLAVIAARGDEAARLPCVVAALYAPVAVWAANRGLQLRDALPVVYLSYLVLGIVLAAALERLWAAVGDVTVRALLAAGLAAAAGAFCIQQATVFLSKNDEAASVGVRIDSWDSPFVHEISGWMESHLPAGAHVLSSRLYFSSLHVQTEGRFEIRQLPTVRVGIDTTTAPMVRAESNLFRWGDVDLRATQDDDTWIYLKRFPGKGYWNGLAEAELLAYIDAHGIEYVVLTGDDLAFSSLDVAAYLSRHPAFTLMETQRRSSVDQFFVYAVDRTRLGPQEHSTAINPTDAAELRALTGLTDAQISRAIGAPLRVTDMDYGLSPREEWAAVAGIDLGLD